ncbi:MAG: XdhC family protein [Alphaproteobacteria bacterium]|nr:XdhC family protein [Alphaproteobacteria bacterium]
MRRIAELRDQGDEFCVATVVRTEHATSAKAGAKAVITRGGEIEGFLGGSCVQGAVKQAAGAVLAEGAPRLIRVKPKDQVVEQLDIDGVELHKSSCPSGGTVELFVEPMLLAPHLLICGASPVAVALAALGSAMGYRVTAAALEEELPRFTDADRKHAGFDLSTLGVDENAYIVVSTQGKRDREALAAALGSTARYVAFVGSRRKSETLLAHLREQALTADQLAKLSAPAGLDINAIGPEEIALSILAEIVSIRRQTTKAPVTAKEKLFSAAAKLVQAADNGSTAIDIYPKCC